MKRFRLLWLILKTTGTDKITLGFIGFVFFIAFMIRLVEPSIATYGDALWYVFVSFTTIGYGDFAAVTVLGRLFVVLVTCYGIFVVALIPGVVVSYFTEATAIRNKKSVAKFLDRLENLPSLSQDELAEISSNIKKGRYKL